jgi:OOP family OmpA-OmpF porin
MCAPSPSQDWELLQRSNLSLDHAHFDSALTTNGATGLSASDSGSDNKWRLQGGYRFNPNLAVEAGYIDFGKTKYSASYGGGSAQGSLKAGGVDVVGLLGLPLSDSLSVFAKAGMVATKVDSRLTAGAPAARPGREDADAGRRQDVMRLLERLRQQHGDQLAGK